jgi:hypothetical protein
VHGALALFISRKTIYGDTEIFLWCWSIILTNTKNELSFFYWLS